MGLSLLQLVEVTAADLAMSSTDELHLDVRPSTQQVWHQTDGLAACTKAWIHQEENDSIQTRLAQILSHRHLGSAQPCCSLRRVIACQTSPACFERESMICSITGLHMQRHSAEAWHEGWSLVASDVLCSPLWPQTPASGTLPH